MRFVCGVPDNIYCAVNIAFFPNVDAGTKPKFLDNPVINYVF